MKKHIPNLFTLMNLFFGCCAIVATFQSGTMATMDESGAMLIEIPEPIYYASLFIAMAGVVDFFDGFVARWLKVDSELGKQLDSLADVVSFGVAPSFIVFQFLRLSLASDANALNNSSLLMAPAFIIAIAGAYRLAKFNIDTVSVKQVTSITNPSPTPSCWRTKWGRKGGPQVSSPPTPPPAPPAPNSTSGFNGTVPSPSHTEESLARSCV